MRGAGARASGPQRPPTGGRSHRLSRLMTPHGTSRARKGGTAVVSTPVTWSHRPASGALMRRHSTARRAAASILALVALVWHAQAGVPPSREESPEFSPLYARRLAVGLANLDSSPGLIRTAHLEITMRPVSTPLSGNPLSLCIGSACLGSVCLGSACAGSTCLGSACSASACTGSGCVASGCAGSACANSACAGSLCLGSACLGSACLGSACLGSACASSRCASCPRPATEDPRG